MARGSGHVEYAAEGVPRRIATRAGVGQVYNVGSDEEVTMHRLAEMVRDAAGSSSGIVLVPYSEAYAEGFEDMMRRVPDPRKLESAIAFRPRISLEKIIADVVADQRVRLAAR